MKQKCVGLCAERETREKNDKNERETHRVFGFSFISLIAIVDEPHWSAHRSGMDLFLIKSTSCEGFGINRFKSPPVWDSRNTHVTVVGWYEMGCSVAT